MADTLVFNPTLTNAGQAAAFNAANDGLQLSITHVSFGTGKFAPTGNETALANQVVKVPLSGGSRPTSTQIRISSVWKADTGTYAVTEVGFWAGDILFSVWSTAAGTVMGYKTPGVDFVLFNDLSLTQVPADSITLTIDSTQSVALAALSAHEGADNAHPQYVRYDLYPDAQVFQWAKTVAGTANAIALTMQDGVKVAAYKAGQRFTFKAASNNTGPVTVAINGLAAKTVVKNGGEALLANEIKAGAVYDLSYDGTQMQITGGVGGSGSLITFQSRATQGQAQITGLTYTPGNVQVFINGRRLQDEDFTATDGATVTLATPLTGGQAITVEAVRTFSVADAYTKAETAARFKPLAAVADVTSAVSLTAAAHVGNLVRVNLAAKGTVTLPAISTLPYGGSIELRNISTSVPAVVAAAAGDALGRGIALLPLSTIRLVADVANKTWALEGGSAEVFDAVGANVIGQLGLRNRLINPSFAVWQRGLSRSLSSQSVYVADRFIASTGNNGACTVQRLAHAAGYGLGSGYLNWVQTTASSDFSYPSLSQRLESVKTLEGRKATFSLHGSASVAMTCTVVLRQYFGSGGSPSATVETTVGGITMPVNWGRQSISFDVPSIAGKSLGTNGDDFVELLVLMPSGATFTMNTWDWQLEEGAIMTPFEIRPPALELVLCQRYCEFGNYLLEGYCTTGGGAGISYWVDFKTPKRAVPTVTLSGTSGVNMGAHAVQGTGINGFQPRATAQSSAQSYISGNYLAEAEL